MAKKKKTRKRHYRKSEDLELKILKAFQQKLYVKQIAKKLNYSQARISQIKSTLVKKGLITQINVYPKTYDLTNKGISYLQNQGKFSKKSIKFDSQAKKEQDLTPDWVLEERVHKLKYSLPLFHKPPYLYSLNRYGKRRKVNDLWISKIRMNNWDKFNLYFPYSKFNGLTCVEVGTSNIVFDFGRDEEDSLVDSEMGFLNYFAEREKDVLQCAMFLNQKGFKIDIRKPKRISQTFAIESNGKDQHIGSLGQKATLIIKSPEETFEVDHSPPHDSGEEETDNFDKAKSIFDVPKTLDNMDKRVGELDTQLNTLDNKLSNIENALIQLVNQNGKMLNQQSKMATQQSKMATQLEKFMNFFQDQATQQSQDQATQQSDKSKGNSFYS